MTSSVSHRIIIIFSCPLDHLCRQESVREAAPRVPPDPALPPTREDAQCRFPHTSSRLTRSVFLLVITVTLQSARNRGAGRRATTHRSTPRAGYPRYPSRWSSVRCAGSAAPSRRPHSGARVRPSRSTVTPRAPVQNSWARHASCPTSRAAVSR